MILRLFIVAYGFVTCALKNIPMDRIMWELSRVEPIVGRYVKLVPK